MKKFSVANPLSHCILRVTKIDCTGMPDLAPTLMLITPWHMRRRVTVVVSSVCVCVCLSVTMKSAAYVESKVS